MKKVLTIILGGFLLALVVIFLTQKPKNPTSLNKGVMNNAPTTNIHNTNKTKKPILILRALVFDIQNLFPH